MSENHTPADLKYTSDHEWVRQLDETTVRVGITHFAQSELGDIVFVQLPSVDDEVQAGESFAEVESTKSVSDIFGPLAGTVVAVNDALSDAPELVNQSPYDQGWLADIAVADEATLTTALNEMLDADEYADQTAG